MTNQKNMEQGYTGYGSTNAMRLWIMVDRDMVPVNDREVLRIYHAFGKHHEYIYPCQDVIRGIKRTFRNGAEEHSGII